MKHSTIFFLFVLAFLFIFLNSVSAVSIIRDSQVGSPASSQTYASGVMGNDAFAVYNFNQTVIYNWSTDGGTTWQASGSDLNIGKLKNDDTGITETNPVFAMAIDTNTIGVIFNADNISPDNNSHTLFTECTSFDTDTCSSAGSWSTPIDFNAFVTPLSNSQAYGDIAVTPDGNYYVALWDKDSFDSEIHLFACLNDTNCAVAANWDDLGYVTDLNLVGTLDPKKAIDLFYGDQNLHIAYSVPPDLNVGVAQIGYERWAIDDNALDDVDSNVTPVQGVICDGSSGPDGSCTYPVMLVDDGNLEYIGYYVSPNGIAQVVEYDEASWTLVSDLNTTDEFLQLTGGIVDSANDQYWFFTLGSGGDQNVNYAIRYDANATFSAYRNITDIDGNNLNHVNPPQILTTTTQLGLYYNTQSGDQELFTYNIATAAFSSTPGNTAPTTVLNLVEFTPIADLNWFSYVRDANLTIDFNIVDDNNDSITLDINFSQSVTQGTGTVIVSGLTLSLTECGSTTFSTTNNCTYDWNIHQANVTSDGNYFINLLISDGTDTNYVSTPNLGIDNNAALTTTTDINTSWQNSDVNVFLTCSDNNSGCTTTYYQLDQNQMDGVTYGALTVYDSNIYFPTDGNYALSWFSSDVVDNNETATIDYVLVDKSAPNFGADFNADTNDTDIFYGLEDMISFRVRDLLIDDGNGAPIATVTVNISDFNTDSTDYNSVNQSGDGNFITDINAGIFDQNFLIKYFTVTVTDEAGNVQTDYNVNYPFVTYAMGAIPGFSGADTNNFQDITNFSSVAGFTLHRTNEIWIQFLATLNLSAPSNATILDDLNTIVFSAADLTNGDTNIFLNLSSFFADANSAARIIVYNVNASEPPNIIYNDVNCSVSVCMNRSLDTDANTYTFDVNGFSTYLIDSDAPIITSVSATAGETSALITLTTNETATCRYNQSPTVGYNSMPSIDQTAGTSHSYTNGNLVGENAYTFTIRCQDTAGNVRSTTSSFTTTAITLKALSSSGVGQTLSLPAGGLARVTGMREASYPARDVAALSEVLKANGYSEHDISKARSIQNLVSFKRVFTSVDLISKDGTEKQTIVELIFTNASQRKMTEVKLVEVISKIAARDGSRLKAEDLYRLVNPDPVIEFSLGDIEAGASKSVVYVIKEDLSKEALASFAAPIVLGVLFVPLQEQAVQCGAVECKDNNPCTLNQCNKGQCIYSSLPLNGEPCGLNGVCSSGECIETALPVPVTGSQDVLLYVVAGVVILASAFLMFTRKKKKK